MNSAMLLLLFGASLTNAQVSALQTWDRLSWTYRLPPMAWSPDVVSPNAVASFRGLDDQGRARVGMNLAPSDMTNQLNIAHEAAHALLDGTGMTVDQQHVWTDDFGACNFGKTPSLHTCEEVNAFFHPYGRMQ